LTWPGLGCSEARAATLAISEAGLSRERRVEGCNRDALDARFVASVARPEEKGSDVNVASHLPVDTLTGTIDAAVVINNDSRVSRETPRVSIQRQSKPELCRADRS
jgi:hypothetical protein